MSLYPAVHVSAITADQRCPRSHYYADSSWGLGYRPIVDNNNILLGNWVHYQQRLVQQGAHPLAACQSTLDRQYALWEKWGVPIDHAAELQLLFFNLMKAHAWWQANDNSYLSDFNLEWVHVEEGFSIPYAGYLFEGQWDGVVRHKITNELFVFERKTTKRPNEIEAGINWDWQPIGYAWAGAQIMGQPIAGVIYEIIKNTDPTQVKMLKSGFPSTAKDELDSTSYEVYYKALQDSGADLEKYQPQLDYLKEQPNPVFRRLPVSVSPGDLESWPQQFIRKAEGLVRHYNEAEATKGENTEYNLDRHNCYNFCPFRDVCLAQRDGKDWRELLEIEFVQRGKERL